MNEPLKTIYELVRKAEKDLTEGETTISEYVQWSLYKNTNKVDAYLNSRHISGERDSQGREKPFFNIVTAAVNIWYRATDIDRKNIRLKADKRGDYILSFIASILLSQWMRKTSFGAFLNKWGMALARYGSIPVKFVEKNGELHAEVIPWNRMICDSIDFENNIKIEKLWLTPAQLRKNKSYNQEFVEELIDKVELGRRTLDNTAKDNKSEYIPIYEIHGELEEAYLTDNEEDTDFVQQMHAVCFEAKREDADDSFDEWTLYRGREEQDPYMMTHLIQEDDRVQSIGAVEYLFEAQWMLNHTSKLVKDQLDLASKLIYQTADANFAGQNALTSIQNGQILVHQPNMPLTQMNNSSHDIGQILNYAQQWQFMAKELTATPDAIRGNTMPSGTAFRQVAILNQEANSLFELMTENKGLQIEEMMRKFVIPHLKKKMDTTEEITEILNEYQIKKLDSMYVPNKAVKMSNILVKQDILNKSVKDIRAGNLMLPQVQQANIEQNKQALQEGLNQQGNERFIAPSDIKTKTWKEVLKDFEWDIRVEITNEEKDTQAVMQTLASVMQTIAGLQGQTMPEEMRVIFNKILEEAGAISPLEFSQSNQQSIQQPTQLPTNQPAFAPANQ